MREWKNRHGRKCRGGKGGSGKIGTAGVENAGMETSGKIDTDAECYAGVCREKNG